ncbi:MAG: hypothetical protein ACI91B_003888, partial [Planctomycetota bacterium]
MSLTAFRMDLLALHFLSWAVRGSRGSRLVLVELT